MYEYIFPNSFIQRLTVAMIETIVDILNLFYTQSRVATNIINTNRWGHNQQKDINMRRSNLCIYKSRIYNNVFYF